MITATLIGALLGAATIGLASVGLPISVAFAVALTLAAGLGLLLSIHQGP